MKLFWKQIFGSQNAISPLINKNLVETLYLSYTQTKLIKV